MMRITFLLSVLCLTSFGCPDNLAATAFTIPAGTPWLYRRIFHANDIIWRGDFYGLSGNYKFRRADMDFVSKIELPNGLDHLKALLTAAAQGAPNATKSSVEYLIEWAGMDPTNGRLFVLKQFSNGKYLNVNQAPEAQELLDRIWIITGVAG